jgi:ATPase subunit of ABC transporter with duplicated ATPase domains
VLDAVDVRGLAPPQHGQPQRVQSPGWRGSPRPRAARPRLGGISLQVAPGEIVGVSGITGSGREEIAAAVFGAVDRLGGRVVIGGQVVKPRRPDLASAAAASWSSAAGKTSLSAGSAPSGAGPASDSPRSGPTPATGSTGSTCARPAGAQESPLSAFSGGNQQKIVFAKWLHRRSSCSRSRPRPGHQDSYHHRPHHLERRRTG